MSLPNGRLWVNPEGVTAVGDSYRGHAALYERHLRHVQMLRAHYADAWGDDDMGKEFSQKFLAGLDDLENLLAGVRGTLDYTATALRAAGISYREADDNAAEFSHRLGARMDDTAGETLRPTVASTPATPTTPSTPAAPGKKA